MRRIAWLSVTAAALCGCASTPDIASLPQGQAWLAAGGAVPPPASACPFVADVDLAAIAASQAAPAPGGASPAALAEMKALLDQVTVGAGDRSPPSDASVVLTAVQPPGGMYANTVWSVVWKEADGHWWFWRQNRTNEPPPPPPPRPRPDASPAQWEAFRIAMQAYPPPDNVRWPPQQGRLSLDQVAVLESSLSSDCRAWEPDSWPWDVPVRSRGRGRAQPPQDWSPFYVQINEMGRPPRLLSAPQGRPSHIGVIVDVASYPRP